MLRMRNMWGWAVLLLLALGLAACEKRPAAPATAPLPTPTWAEVPLMPAPSPTPTGVPPTPVPSPTPTEVLPMPAPPVVTTVAPSPIPEALFSPEPQEIAFKAEDGQALIGTYYPALGEKAPLVVLMHWAPGDAHEWDAIAPWLQNRGLAGPSSPPANKPWIDSRWFPPLPRGRSYAVFTFTFRHCEGGCRQLARGAWLLDAQAAMRTARQLKGVDPERIVAVGASIGADGAIDACYALNEEFSGSCQGAFSLSPGDYLTITYREAVSRLGKETPPKPAWCLYAEKDTASAKACQEAQGENYRSWRYPGEAHGMMLLAPGVEPNVLPLLLEFLEGTLG